MSDQDMMCFSKPDTIYDRFERKAGSDKTNTHYCPGCGHGRIQKYIASALIELGIEDKTIFLSPVGCSVFGYYYMNTGNIACSHGRAPAVGTGANRARPNSVIIDYQGDGDLSAIGGNEILHAANRGENMVCFFINNAIYGMTGGQMSPTTTIGQKTVITPRGRSVAEHGHPIRMAEIIATLEAPIYVERVSCTDPRGIHNTRRAIKKALTLVNERKGFCFIEILSACPTGWKKTPVDSIQWIKEHMEQTFKPAVYKDISQDAPVKPMLEQVEEPQELFKLLGLEKGMSKQHTSPLKGERHLKFAGFGGQGVLTSGLMVANGGMYSGLESSWIPSYGPEMRGGTANCQVVLSDKQIGSPFFSKPDYLFVMNGPSLDAFEKDVKVGGTIVVNTSVITQKVARTDVRAVYLPLTQIAADLGDKTVANLVLVGAYLALDPVIEKKCMLEVIEQKLHKKEFLELNRRAIEAGFDWVKSSKA